MKYLVTGGAGFIGSALIRKVIAESEHQVVNVDCLTYAGNLQSLADVAQSPRYVFEQVDICDGDRLAKVFARHQPDAVIHLAAESHVDRSIDAPGAFIQTNVVGTLTMLECASNYLSTLEEADRAKFRFLHVSTDEVFGDLSEESVGFNESTPYAPSSPYSASKAASDHLVRAWNRTYGFPALISNCSNNYGPHQFPEKLIPLMIINAINGKPLPVYGDGQQIRDWLYVDDHADALLEVVTKGQLGSSYNVGGNNEMRNLDVVETICDLLDELQPNPDSSFSYRSLITRVADRPGHDRRYAIDNRFIQDSLGWTPSETFESGIRKTVLWYLENRGWWESVQNGSYLRWREEAEVQSVGA